MATTSAVLSPKVGKSTLSMFLRTNCDRELFFSLFKSEGAAQLIAHGIPAPLSARPNIELVTRAGEQFESREMEWLYSYFGASNVVCNRTKPGDFADIDLLAAIGRVPVPGFILQPSLNPTPFRSSLLIDDFGLTASEESVIPTLSGLRPDVIIAKPRGALQWEVLPNGRRKALAASDCRTALSVVDLKNAVEGNKSYAAEVVLYSIFLSKFLEQHGLQGEFFVSEECYLWTNVGKPTVSSLPATASILQKLDALQSDLEPVVFPVIAPSVVKFFKEDLPRVLGRAAAGGWSSLDFHVGPRCSNCDWLGFSRWLSTSDRALLAANPTWYCSPAANSVNHLSKLPGVSKGARRVLEANSVTDLPALSALPPAATALSGHGLLKKARNHLAPTAQAILTNTSSVDASAVLAGLAKDVQLQVAIAVNFDAAAGLLTGIALRATLFMPFGSPKPVIQIADWGAVVDSQTLNAEWDVLYAFLAALEHGVQTAESNLGGAMPRTQILFWEQRQFQELCGAVGRHLPKILALRKRGKGVPRSLVPALMWLFPPEELVPRDAAVSPHIIFLKDIAQRVLRLPVAHAFTLRSAYEAYSYPMLAPGRLDPYFIDPLGNGIPRERIFEVWKNTGVLLRAGRPLTKSQACADYIAALKAQSRGIASIAAQMASHFKGHLKGSARQLSAADFKGATGVAEDSKLWLQWEKVETATAAAQRKLEFTLAPEILEAEYKALVLLGPQSVVSPTRAVYAIRADSSEAKLDDTGSYYAVGDLHLPGYPLQTPASLGLPFHPSYLPHGVNAHQLPLYSLVRAQIHTLDRVRLLADVEFHPRSAACTDVFGDLIGAGLLPVTRGHLFLMDSMPYDDSRTTASILREVGNPRCATPDPAALGALAAAATRKAGTDPDGPLARLLWDANAIAATPVRTFAQAQHLATRAQQLVQRPLDSSQVQAIEGLSQQALSLVWGPPGTGKTSTLVGYLLAVVEEALARRQARKILLSGPNYRAVEVLGHRLLEELTQHPSLVCDLFLVYSRSRAAAALPVASPPSHLNADSVNLADATAVAGLQAAYASAGVSIFCTSAHTVPALVSRLRNSDAPLQEAFDLVVIDESSQVPVNLALRPLASLKPQAEVIIAGDKKQMPPIQALTPPAGAEHLVGSVHQYLLTRFNLSEQKLLVNYRSADHIVEYAKTLGYPTGLTANTPAQRLQFVSQPATVALPSGAPSCAAWADVLHPDKVVATLLHDDPTSSQANHVEAKIVALLAFLLRQCVASSLAPSSSAASLFASDDDFFRAGLGVVTPHKAQRALVLAELSRLFPGASRRALEESVDTVERFQGGQRHTIIVSFAVGDLDVIEGEEEFLLQMERANVAISRAMAKCIVVMPRSLAYHLPGDVRVAETARALKAYVDEFCDQHAQHLCNGTDVIEVRWR